jgi:hypothetical protein
MKMTIDIRDFRSAFKNCSRENNFSAEALCNLFDYLENLEAETGEEIELDVIAICCDYTEEKPQEVCKSYSIDFEVDGKELSALHNLISALPASVANKYWDIETLEGTLALANALAHAAICKAARACIDAGMTDEEMCDFNQDNFESEEFKAACEALNDSGEFSVVIINDEEKTVTYKE